MRASMFFSFRRLLIALLLFALIALIGLALRPTPLRVDLGQVTTGPLRVTVNAEGKTRLRQRFVISAPVSGRVARLTLREGDTVTPDMVVAHIDPLPSDAAVREAQGRLAEWKAQRDGVATLRPKQEALTQGRARVAAAQAAQRKAEARVEQARATLEQARREYQRALKLETSGTISREARETAQMHETIRSREYDAAVLEVQGTTSDVEAARAALAVLEAQQRDPDYLLDVYSARISSVEAELARLRDEKARTAIRAPSHGRVLRVLQENERMVTAGTPLLEVGDVTALEILVDVLSTDAVRIQPGASVLLERWGGGHPLQARVRLIEPAAFTKISALGIEEQRVNVIADFLTPPEMLGDGYRVEARILVWESAQVLSVPASALFRCREAWCVFVAVDGKARRQLIEIGQRNDVAVEVRQ
ncbi:MAG: HlyD family efflux transporter periplasmic adaptor subunit, partial [Candidatus Tectomicrobia bacterium]|nr:HlyD family efflux transporter periplasmic adaptor subunit [Candidatus Tectomicrobia bacterium]